VAVLNSRFFIVACDSKRAVSSAPLGSPRGSTPRKIQCVSSRIVDRRFQVSWLGSVRSFDEERVQAKSTIGALTRAAGISGTREARFRASVRGQSGGGFLRSILSANANRL
jgi:hypothetical protein